MSILYGECLQGVWGCSFSNNRQCLSSLTLETMEQIRDWSYNKIRHEPGAADRTQMPADAKRLWPVLLEPTARQAVYF
jgi:hypothetical protein